MSKKYKVISIILVFVVSYLTTVFMISLSNNNCLEDTAILTACAIPNLQEKIINFVTPVAISAVITTVYSLVINKKNKPSQE